MSPRLLSTRHQRFTCVRLPDPYLTRCSRAFSSPLTTLALYQRRVKWFETWSCTPVPRGPPSSLVQHCVPFRLPAFGCAFVAHDVRSAFAEKGPLSRPSAICICVSDHGRPALLRAGRVTLVAPQGTAAPPAHAGLFARAHHDACTLSAPAVSRLAGAGRSCPSAALHARPRSRIAGPQPRHLLQRHGVMRPW
jgi:hypothetical protein